MAWKEDSVDGYGGFAENAEMRLVPVLRRDHHALFREKDRGLSHIGTIKRDSSHRERPRHLKGMNKSRANDIER
jgi:hypothetical protein